MNDLFSLKGAKNICFTNLLSFLQVVYLFVRGGIKAYSSLVELAFINGSSLSLSSARRGCLQKGAVSILCLVPLVPYLYKLHFMGKCMFQTPIAMARPLLPQLWGNVRSFGGIALLHCRHIDRFRGAEGRHLTPNTYNLC